MRCFEVKAERMQSTHIAIVVANDEKEALSLLEKTNYFEGIPEFWDVKEVKKPSIVHHYYEY